MTDAEVRLARTNGGRTIFKTDSDQQYGEAIDKMKCMIRYISTDISMRFRAKRLT